MPHCTRRATLHAHHLKYRSHGEDDQETNLATLCEFHHLQGVHKGRIRVKGEAPDGLEWELGVRHQSPPHMRVRGRWLVEAEARPPAAFESLLGLLLPVFESARNAELVPA